MRYYFKGNGIYSFSKSLKIAQDFNPIGQVPFEDQNESLEWLKKYLTNSHHVNFYECKIEIKDKKGKDIEGLIKKDTKYKIIITRDEKISSKECFLIINNDKYELEFEDGETEVIIKFKDDENIIDIDEQGEYMLFMPANFIKAE